MASLAEHAVVIGAGVAGCLGAAALSRHFSRVTLLERDDLDADESRTGLPQGKQPHLVLRGGLDAMEQLLPGLEARLRSHGAVTLRPAKDLLSVTAKGPVPQRDVGPIVLAQSRLLLDRLVREQVRAIPNVRVLLGSRVERLLGNCERVTGVRLSDAVHGETLEADFVLDGSGRAAHCLAWLRALDVTLPPETNVHRKLHYATRLLELPDAGDSCAAVAIFPTRDNRRGGFLLPIENQRWLLTLISPPALSPRDDDAFQTFLAALPAPQIAERVAGAIWHGKVERFGFDGSCHRHFEQLACLPHNLVCTGDALCTFNPIYGQGMSVAALEAGALDALLRTRPHGAAWDDGLAAAFFAKAAEIIATPWALATYPDLSEPDGEGAFPPDFELVAGQQRALARLAAQDPEVHALHLEALHLVRPWSSLLAPPLGERVAELLRVQRPKQAS